MDAVSAVTAALTDDQRAAIVARFTAVNPHWTGANADDILDALDQSDSNLEIVEPFWEAYPDLPGGNELGVAARALIWSRPDDSAAADALTPEAVLDLANRAAAMRRDIR